jgi:hypothetical protein
MYFYSNKGDCSDCQKEGFVLTKLREDYPDLRIYSFDYNLDLSALQTLISIYGIEKKLPVILINEMSYYGFKSEDDIKNIMPALKAIDAANAKTAALQAKQASTTKSQ